MRRLLIVFIVGAALATACGMWRSRPAPDLPPPVEADTDLAARLAAHVHALAGVIGPRHARDPVALEAAATYIEQRLLELNYPVARQPFTAAGRTVANLEARASRSESRYFVLGAHYDTVPTTPGANDNASGVAVLLEVARLHAASARDAPLRFVAFVNEEPPWFQTELMGSLVYARAARARSDEVLGMISLETMGYYANAAGSQQYPPPFQVLFPSTGHFLAAVSNGSSFGLLRRFARAFKGASPLPLIWSPAPSAIPGVGWSDHWSFWQHGYPALMLTDTAPFRYPHYHTTRDTPDKLDYVRLAYATRGVAAAVRQLAR